MKNLKPIIALLVLAVATTAIAQFTPAQYRTRMNARNCGLVGLPSNCTDAQYHAAPGSSPAITIWPDISTMNLALSQRQIDTEYALMVDEQADQISSIYRSSDSVKRRQICNSAGVANFADVCF